MENFLGMPRYVNSEMAEKGAERLLSKIKNKELVMDVLPNKYEKFVGKLEEEDYISYVNFLRTMNGKKIISALEEEDAGRFVRF